jgi:hypothetical protein
MKTKSISLMESLDVKSFTINDDESSLRCRFRSGAAGTRTGSGSTGLVGDGDNDEENTDFACSGVTSPSSNCSSYHIFI